MECIFSSSKQRVFWRNLQTDATTWKTPVTPSDAPASGVSMSSTKYDPTLMANRDQVNPDIQAWRDSCNADKKGMHTAHARRNATHLDLSCGRGGDVHKLRYAGVKQLIGIDVCPAALEECVRRAHCAGVKGRFFLADLTTPSEAVLAKLESYTFGSISIMYALHYLCTSKHDFGTFLGFLQRLHVTDDCRFYGIVPDYREIMIRTTAGDYAPFDGCRVTRPSPVPTSIWRDDERLFGNAYQFSLAGSVHDLTEYLVYMPVIETMVEALGWEALAVMSLRGGCGLYLSFVFGRRRCVQERPPKNKGSQDKYGPQKKQKKWPAPKAS